MAPKKLNVRISVPSESRDDWNSFSNYAKENDTTASDLVLDLIRKHLEENVDNDSEEFDESALLAELTGTPEESTEEETPSPKTKKVMVKKPIAPKKKSFLARKATITKKREEPEDSDVTIQDTPKFRLLELVRSLDVGEGIDPDTLVTKAEEEGIVRPRLQMNKMIRRGILYVHLDRVHVT